MKMQEYDSVIACLEHDLAELQAEHLAATQAAADEISQLKAELRKVKARLADSVGRGSDSFTKLRAAWVKIDRLEEENAKLKGAR